MISPNSSALQIYWCKLPRGVRVIGAFLLITTLPIWLFHVMLISLAKDFYQGDLF